MYACRQKMDHKTKEEITQNVAKTFESNISNSDSNFAKRTQ